MIFIHSGKRIIVQIEADDDWEDFDLCLEDRDDKMLAEKKEKKVARAGKKKIQKTRHTMTAKDAKKKRRKARKAPFRLNGVEEEKQIRK